MQNDKLARAFVVGDLLRSAKGAARTTSRVRSCFAPHSVLRGFLKRSASLAENALLVEVAPFASTLFREASFWESAGVY